MTRKEEIEQAAHKYIQSDVVSPENMQLAFGDFSNGAEWADRTMLDKVCDWLKSYRQDTYDGTGYIAGIVNDKTIEDLRKAMED